MEKILTQFANSGASEKADLLGSLGIDWTLLSLQTVAFLILLFVLRKFVYPPIMEMLIKREKDLRAADLAAKSAKENADKAEEMTAEMMRKARAEANKIVTSAREEAAEAIEDATKKAAVKSEALIKEAHDKIAQEVANAKKELHNSTLELVAEATGKVLGEKLDTKKDAKLISTALKEAE